MDNGHRGVRRLVTTIVIAVAAAFVWVVISTLWLWRNQERVVFQPPSVTAPAPAPARRVEYAAADGHPLAGYFVLPGAGASTPSTLVIAFHGNADLAVWFIPWAHELADREGVAVFLPEYRGYAGIPGPATYAAAAADAIGALRFALGQFPAARLVLFGHSLGTAIATEAAATLPPARRVTLVLQSPFTSAREMATRMFVPPWQWLWRIISRVPYDTRTRVARLDDPVWVAHGTRDIVVPVRMGRLVFNAARRKGELLIVDGAGHNDVADVGGERYWRWLGAAVSSVPVGELEKEGDRRLP